jgi:hypothetical protein
MPLPCAWTAFIFPDTSRRVMFRGAIVFASGMTVGFVVGAALGGTAGACVGYFLGMDEAESMAARSRQNAKTHADVVYDDVASKPAETPPADAEGEAVEVPVTENQDQGESNDGE